MSNKQSKFSWTKLYIFNNLTQKKTSEPKGAGAVILPVIIIGAFVLHLPWWLLVILILIGVALMIKK